MSYAFAIVQIPADRSNWEKFGTIDYDVKNSKTVFQGSIETASEARINYVKNCLAWRADVRNTDPELAASITENDGYMFRVVWLDKKPRKKSYHSLYRVVFKGNMK